MSLPYFNKYPKDFLRACAGLGPELIGTYEVILCLIYARGRPIEMDLKHIGGLLGVGQAKTRNLIHRLFAKDKLYLTADGLISNERADRELANRKLISRQTAEAGVLSGEARRAKGKKAKFRENSEIIPELFGNSCEGGDNENSDLPRTPARARKSQYSDRVSNLSDAGPASGDGAGPDFGRGEDDPDEAERAELEAASRLPGNRLRREDRVDMPALTARIMQLASMVMPPSDLVLVSAWVNQGFDVELDILAVVERMCSHAKSPPRSMRYFDAEIRRFAGARLTSSDTTIDEFDDIIRRIKSVPAD